MILLYFNATCENRWHYLFVAIRKLKQKSYSKELPSSISKCCITARMKRKVLYFMNVFSVVRILSQKDSFSLYFLKNDSLWRFKGVI